MMRYLSLAVIVTTGLIAIVVAQRERVSMRPGPQALLIDAE